MLVIRAGRAAEGAGEPGDVDAEPGPRRRSALLLDEPVHDGVAAVREDHEQGADAIVRGAPERLDAVERRAVADDGDHGPVRPRHAHADRGREREAEPAHRSAQEAERLPRGNARVQLGAVRRRLLDHDRIAGQALCEGGEDVTGAKRLAGRREAAEARVVRTAREPLPCAAGRCGRARRRRRRARPAAPARPGCGGPRPDPR